MTKQFEMEEKNMKTTPANQASMASYPGFWQTQGNAPGAKTDSNTPKSWDDLPLCFGVETLAFIMGCSIGKARTICSDGGQCCYKEGKRYIIFKQNLLEWLEQRSKNAKRTKSA